MTKRELIAELAESRGMHPREARAVVDAIVHSIERALTDGEAVTLRGFGRFDVRPRASRNVRAPGSAQSVRVPARLAPVFHGAPELTRRLSIGGKKPRRGRRD